MQGPNRQTSQGRRQPANDSSYQIYVGDLDPTVSKQQLVDHFRKKYHSVADGKIITDQATKLSKGYGFVQFSSYDESQRALTEMQGTLIKGKPVKVSQGVSRHSDNRPGNSRGGNTGNSNSAMLNQIYGSPGKLLSLLGQNILGGLGVQFKAPEGVPQSVYGMHPQHLALIQASQQSLLAQQPFANPQFYPSALAGQQVLLYGYPQHMAQKDPNQSADLSAAYAQSLQAGIAGQNLMNPGLYPQAHVGNLAAQMGYPLYMPTQQGPPSWLAPQPKEEPIPQKMAEELPIEIACHNKLAVLNFMQNYDLKAN